MFNNEGRKEFMLCIATILLLSLFFAKFGDDYTLRLLVLCWLFSMLAISQDIVYGRAGQLLLCIGAFFGIGAYSSAIMSLRIGLTFGSCFLFAVFLTSLVSLIIGFISTRVGGHYLAIVTLSFSVITHQIILNLDSLTNGALGLNNIPSPNFFQLSLFHKMGLSIKGMYLMLSATSLMFTLWVAYRLTNSKAGTKWTTVKEDEIGAQSIGIDIRKSKVEAILAAGAIAGAAGSLYAHYQGLIAPEDFTFSQSVNPLIMVILGGSGTLAGPVIGAALLILLPEYLRFLSDYRWVIFGSALIICMAVFPRGLWGIINLLWSKARHKFTPSITESHGNN